ncbi:hypothetical protein F8388_014865 [Cannabis sativa]|uniref:Zinc knuckle CX2CX4HX4C domain-containing protein n=1 Tax=Cannabis sativa TaxID=3483 RepID=A0A7J6F619_CANSA|nr:hypothetical protein F8388_014865 [Cannabis sativa]KAF4395558.1 hypothetical protein G4B88_011022 [Cannabis sativa]
MGNSSESWKNNLTVFPIWGRALGVPIDNLTGKNTLRLASMASSVITVQNSDVSRMVADGFFRFQVWMSINKPVCPGYLLPRSGSKKWVAFKYDELPFMCFRCGWIGHSQKDYSLDIKEITGENGTTAMAYGTWLKVENGVRDGFHGVKGGNTEGIISHEQSPQGVTRPTLNLCVGNSFDPLSNEGYENVQLRSEATKEKSPIHGTRETHMLPTSITEKPQQEETGVEENAMLQDGRGKRRLVEDREVVGAGKLQRTANNPNVMIESQTLIDVPISFSKEIPGLKESLPFAFGSGQNSIPKEQRRKVVVKKDAKKRKEMRGFDGILGFTLNMHGLRKKIVWSWLRNPGGLAQQVPRLNHSDLCHRGKKIDPTCDNYGRFEESLSHALWTCEKVKKVWKLMPCYKLIKESRGHSMMDLLVEFRQKLAREEFEDVIKVLWAIWENRNRQWNNQPYMNGPRLLDWVFSSYPREEHTCDSGILTTVPSIVPTEHWPAPPVGTYCVHCDATIQPNQPGVGLGYIWLDWSGNIVSAGMKFLPVCCPVIVAEAKAVITALQDRPMTVYNSYEI